MHTPWNSIQRLIQRNLQMGDLKVGEALAQVVDDSIRHRRGEQEQQMLLGASGLSHGSELHCQTFIYFQ